MKVLKAFIGSAWSLILLLYILVVVLAGRGDLYIPLLLLGLTGYFEYIILARLYLRGE